MAYVKTKKAANRDKRPAKFGIDPDHLLPQVNEHNLFCTDCQKLYSSHGNYKAHLRRVHQYPGSRQNRKKATENSSHKCSDCDKFFSTGTALKLHLRNIHGIHVPVVPKPKPTKKNTHLKPDMHDPNNFCCVCEYTYCNRWNYLNHLRSQHGIEVATSKKQKLKPLPNPDAIPDPLDPSFYCCACDRTFSTKGNFERHMFTRHY